MSWLKLEDTFHNSPKVRKLARRLGTEPVLVRGHLSTLWSWALVHRPDGNLKDLEPEDIEFAAEWQGEPGTFVAEAVRVGFFDVIESGLEIHEWMERAGAWKNALRVRKHREKKTVSRDSNVTVTRLYENVTLERRGEERRRDLDLCQASSKPEEPSPGLPGERLRLFVEGYNEGKAEHMKAALAPGDSTKKRDKAIGARLKEYPMERPEVAGYWFARAVAQSEHLRGWKNWDLKWLCEKDKGGKFEGFLGEGREMARRDKQRSAGAQSTGPPKPVEPKKADFEKTAAAAKEIKEQLGIGGDDGRSDDQGKDRIPL